MEREEGENEVRSTIIGPPAGLHAHPALAGMAGLAATARVDIARIARAADTTANSADPHVALKGQRQGRLQRRIRAWDALGRFLLERALDELAERR